MSFVDHFEDLPSAKNEFAFVEDEVTLRCLLNHSVIWRFSDSIFYDDVSKNGRVTEQYRSIASVGPNGGLSLILANVTKERSGLYVCIENEGRGTEYGIRLNVGGKSNHL